MLALGLVLAGCVSAAPGPTLDWPDPEPVGELPPLRGEYVGEGAPDDVWRIRPMSGPIEHGVAYVAVLGHCGLSSPIDVDGSFWDPVEARDPLGTILDLESHPELINGTPGVIAVIGDKARFRTEAGTVVWLVRHDGAKEFPLCA